MDEAYRVAMILSAIAHAQILTAGMTAENLQRQHLGQAMAYGEREFDSELAYMNQRIDALRL